jgi:signal transduction histidine kinase
MIRDITARIEAEQAVKEERQRLSRELHDSVSQALFGIGLGARTARVLLERDLDQAAHSIDYVLSLAQSGMAEMRALIFELRPESLETEGLVQALTKQAQAVQARYEIPIHLTLCAEPAVPLRVKEALYRIAQEALHNTVKHAQPRSVELSLEQVEGEVALEIRDDGQGFDTGGSFPGHLGLHSMRERAERIGGVLELESQIGEGTRVQVRVPAGSDTAARLKEAPA